MPAMSNLLTATMTMAVLLFSTGAAAGDPLSVEPGGNALADDCLLLHWIVFQGTFTYCGPIAIGGGDATTTKPACTSQGAINPNTFTVYQTMCSYSAAVALTGTSTGVIAAGATGASNGELMGISLTGASSGNFAASGAGPSTATCWFTVNCFAIAISLLGDAHATCDGTASCQSFAVSGTGHSSGSGVVISGCDTLSLFNVEEACTT